MMKYYRYLFSILVFFLVLSTSLSANAEVGPRAELPVYYPGSNVIMRAGDIVYSSKSFGSSTAIVGHVGIVGSDLNVYHVNPAAGNAGKSDGIYAYSSRHGKGETIKVYRSAHGVKAAEWAKNNYASISTYYIPWASWDNFKLGSLDPNYCSKFIWQAFYYGNNKTDYIIGYYDEKKEAYVTPSQVIGSNDLTYAGSFITP